MDTNVAVYSKNSSDEWDKSVTQVQPAQYPVSYRDVQQQTPSKHKLILLYNRPFAAQGLLSRRWSLVFKAGHGSFPHEFENRTKMIFIP